MLLLQVPISHSSFIHSLRLLVHFLVSASN